MNQWGIVLTVIFLVFLLMAVLLTRFKTIMCNPEELLGLADGQFHLVHPISDYCVYPYIPIQKLSSLYEYLLLAYNTTLDICEDRHLEIPNGKREVLYDNQGRQFGLFFHFSDKNVFCFNGTIYPDTWKYNFDMSQSHPEWAPNTKVHSGYLTIYNQLRPKVHQLLKQYPNPNLVIVGASLGGAVATVASLDLHQYFPTVYTFASPRVVDISTANLIADTTNFYRIYNTEDIVVAMPVPVTQSRIYSHIPRKEIGFTMNLGGYSLNHNDAYRKYFETDPHICL